MLEKVELKRVLVEQRRNMLRKDRGIQREALKTVEKKIKLPHVVMITGLRRSGKSTLLRQVMHDYYGDEEFYYIDFEDERFLGFDARRFNDIYEALLGLFGEKKTFFIDEIQKVHSFESFVRRFYDDGFKFFITGSNSELLSREFGTKLTGRHVDLVVQPFSFKEFLGMRGFGLGKDTIHTTSGRVRIKEHFDEYLEKGGMPEYLLHGDIEILMRVYEDIVVKDIIARYDIKNDLQLRELYQYLITNFSKKFSFNSLRRTIDLGSVDTVKRYIGYLQDTHLVSLVNKFDYSLKKQLINDKKLYVLDNGFISAISTKIAEGKGWMLENLVFNALKRDRNIFYYGGKRECDFIVVDRGRIDAAVQVCYELTGENKEREISGLVEAMDKLKLKEGLILTYDQEDEIRLGGKRIVVKPVWGWMLEM
ncbi:MAG: ATP-binding protein [Candidatus Altiarchaeota archaeon]|nr:ATP-binding protein [Candidatus Altiarchaeota archaeon]